jgi:hypothetical protein
VVTFDLKYINVRTIQLSGEPKSLVLLSAVRFLSLGLHITEENMMLAICEACVPEFMEETKKNLEEFIRNESRLSESEIDSMLEKVLDTTSAASPRNSETPTPNLSSNLADFIENIQNSIENFKEEISNIYTQSPEVNPLLISPNKASNNRVKKKRGSSNHNIRSLESPIPRLAHSKSYEKLSTFKDPRYSKQPKEHTCHSKQELIQFSKLMQERFTVPKVNRSPERRDEKVDKKEAMNVALSDIYKISGQEGNLLSCCLLDGDISDLADKLVPDFESKEEEEEEETQTRNMVSREISYNVYEMRPKPVVDIALLHKVRKDSIKIIDLVLNSERKKSDPSPLSASWDYNKTEEEETDFQQACLSDENEPPNGVKLIDLFMRRRSSEVSFSSENSSEENSKIEAAEPETVENEEVLRIPDAGKLKLYTVVEEGSGNLSQIGGSSDDIFKVTNLLSDKHALQHINSCLSEEDSIEFSDDSGQDGYSFTDRSIEEFTDAVVMPTVMQSPVRIGLSPESPVLKSATAPPREPAFNSLDLTLDIQSPISISHKPKPAQMHEAPSSPIEIILNIETPNDTTQNSSQGPKAPHPMKISCEEGKECGCSQCVIM